MNIVEATLLARGQRYGSFQEHADLCQRIKGQMHRSKNWNTLDADMTEALEMIQHKVARVLNGDAHHADNWVDIAGYATLVATRLEDK
jgi:hypothetical protein